VREVSLVDKGNPISEDNGLLVVGVGRGTIVGVK
jgi:hypothetical protein